MREYLKRIRDEKGMTQKEVSASVGISQNYYCDIENGSRQKKMQVDLIIKLSGVFDVSVNEMIKKESEYAKTAC